MIDEARAEFTVYIYTTHGEQGDQVMRETPASRGTETSAEVLVGPPKVNKKRISTQARLQVVVRTRLLRELN